VVIQHARIIEMPKKPKHPPTRNDLVIAPGGPRKRESVHAVEAGESVFVQQGYGPVVTRSPRGIATNKTRSGDAPANFVLTPGGFRHRSLVHRVAKNEALHFTRARIQRINLATKVRKDIAMGRAQLGEVPTLGSGWISYAYWNNDTGSSLTSFRSTWTVPKAPSTDSGQTIFLFNGIQNYGNNYGILQPVLQWGPSAAGGGSYWSIASWYVTSGGDAFHTALVQVDEGDVLIGLMTLTGQTVSGFNYRSEFQGISGTTLNIANIAELLWCNETLEAYGIQECSDYPVTDFTRFWPINIQTGATNPTMTWTPATEVTDCNQHTIIGDNSSTQGDVDIYYRNPSKSRFNFSEMLVVTNPILLWLFKHGWEDPGWGRDDASQISILSALHALADQILDTELRTQVKKLSSEGLAKVANRIAGRR
jgi:hypothetical protein